MVNGPNLQDITSILNEKFSIKLTQDKLREQKEQIRYASRRIARQYEKRAKTLIVDRTCRPPPKLSLIHI